MLSDEIPSADQIGEGGLVRISYNYLTVSELVIVFAAGRALSSWLRFNMKGSPIRCGRTVRRGFHESNRPSARARG